MKIVIYCRTNIHNAADFSIEMQEKACREFVKLQGHTIAAEYIDYVLDGKDTSRLAFTGLMESSRARKFDAVLVYSFDRISRDIQEYQMVRYQLSRNSVTIISVSEPPDSPMGWRLEMLWDYYCQYSRDEHSRRTSLGIQRAKERKAAQRAVMPSGKSENMKGDTN